MIFICMDNFCLSVASIRTSRHRDFCQINQTKLSLKMCEIWVAQYPVNDSLLTFATAKAANGIWSTSWYVMLGSKGLDKKLMIFCFIASLCRAHVSRYLAKRLQVPITEDASKTALYANEEFVKKTFWLLDLIMKFVSFLLTFLCEMCSRRFWDCQKYEDLSIYPISIFVNILFVS